MKHQEAIEREAAERYVLGELAEAEREAFEEHFFECPECAREVQLCAAVLANVRAVLRERPSGLRGWLAPLTRPPAVAPIAVAAGLLLLVLTAYLWLVRVPAMEREIAGLRAPQAYAAYFVRPVVRGEDQIVALPRGAAFLGLAADLPPGAAYSSYRCELLENGETLAAAVSAAAPQQPGAPLHLLLPRSAVRSGRYTLVLRGVAEERPQAELARFSFVLQVE